MRTCVCTECSGIVPVESIHDDGLCTECMCRYEETVAAGHADDCDCADCDFVARVGVARVRALAPEASGPAGLPRYVRDALASKAARLAAPTPYIPRCSTGECACGCDYLVGFPL